MTHVRLVGTLIGIFWRGAPKWLAPLVAHTIPETIAKVRELSDTDLSGDVRFARAVKFVGATLDKEFDKIPEWSALKEAQRDRIIGGMVEFAYFAHKLGAKPGKKRAKLRQQRVRD